MKAKAKGRTFVVIGAGAMGRITVRDLVETAPEGSTVVVADHDEKAARAVARATWSSTRARAWAEISGPMSVSGSMPWPRRMVAACATKRSRNARAIDSTR